MRYTLGGLVLTQTLNRTPKIREPEMRHALAQEAEIWNNILYGIEAPTREKYPIHHRPRGRETRG